MNIHDTILLIPQQPNSLPSSTTHIITKKPWRISDGKVHPVIITKVEEK
jgi:hypothetical protein